MFTPIASREPLSKTVAAKIEEAIRERHLSTGDRLPSEHEMCDQFGVSRTAVREALRMLSARGLISIQKGKGNFVKDLSVDTVTDSLQLYLRTNTKHGFVIDVVRARQIIEPSIAAAAAVNRTEEDVVKLRGDIDQLCRCNEDFEKLAALDMQFHLDIAVASHNTLMPLILDPIHKLLPNIKSSIYKTVDEARDSAVEYHSKILNAIIQRSPGKAHREMTTHLAIAEEHALRMIRANALKE
ncbi:MAG: FadR/GntR family transcriptional regulator [Ignavibacteriales bacterium]|nr:FadR/GntR family transcriptional regulator [Ignavibacteriales bacterium]